MERSRSRSKCNNSLASDLTDQLIIVKSSIMIDEPDEVEPIISPLSDGSAPVGRLLPSPDDKRVDSFTCSCSSAGDKSSTDGGVKSLDAGTDETSPQSVLTVEMFSHFATEYTHPIDGDSDISSRDDSSAICDRRGQSARSGSGILGVIFLDEDRSCENDTSPPATKKSLDSKLKSDDAERSKVDNHRRHRRINSMPISLSMINGATKTPERKIHSGPDEEYPSSHIPVTPSPPQKKPASHMRSRSMPIAELSKIYDNNVPAIASSFELQSSPGPQSHRRIVSAHAPLGDVMKLNGSPNTTCPRAGLPPRPTGTIGSTCSGRTSLMIRKASLTFKTPAPSHRRVNSEPGIATSSTEGTSPITPTLCDKPTALHLRASSYGSFRAIRDASELLYNLQNSSPDPKLLGRRQRHQRGPSLDSRTTQSTGDNTKDGTDESSGEESNAEQCWNAYYEKRKLKKNVVKNELKYRLGRSIPKALTTRKSPELKPASSAKFC